MPHSVDNFVHLVEDLCEHLGQPSPDLELDEEGPVALQIEHDGIAVMLMHQPMVDPDHFTILHPLEPVQEKVEAVNRRALELNQVGFLCGASTALGIDPLSGRMTLLHRDPIYAMSGPQLARTIEKLQQVARAWNDGYFLQGDAAPLVVDGGETADAAVEEEAPHGRG